MPQLLFNYNGAHDFAQVMQQVYVYMSTTDLSFPFNGHTYSFSLWQCFISTIVIGVIVDILVFGFHVMIRRL